MVLAQNSKIRERLRHIAGRAPLLSALGVALAGIAAQPAAAETRGYVVSWFTLAMYDQEGDCPGGVNPSIEDIYRQNLKDMGRSQEDIERIIKGVNGGVSTPETTEVMANRARIDGKPANVYDHPTAFPDDHLHTVEGKFAYGFNLDGKGADSPGSFAEEPETHEKGINNQYFRAMGCVKSHRAFPPERATYWAYGWDGARDSLPAWVMSISGDNLDKDGDVTVTFDKAMEHINRDANGEPVVDSTFRIDPDPRWHNVYKAKIKDQVLTIVPGGEFHMSGDPFLITRFDFRQVHIRLKMKPDRSLDGVLGGYQPWLPIYFFYGGSGYTVETMVGIDMPGTYYNLRRLADAYPDPKTGVNTHISAAYRLELVPAFLTQPNEKTAQAQTPQSR